MSSQSQLNCKPPPCPCHACKKRRKDEAEGREKRKSSSQLAVRRSTSNAIKQIGKQTDKQNGKDGIDKQNDKRKDFVTFATETMAIIAFFIIATTCFWLAVSYYVFQFGLKIYNSDRNIQIIAACLMGLLILSISWSLMSKKSWRSCAAKKSNEVTTIKAVVFTPPAAANSTTSEKPCCKWMPSFTRTKMENKNVTITITDNKAHEVFKQSKIYAIPSELKKPPAILVYLRDVILQHY